MRSTILLVSFMLFFLNGKTAQSAHSQQSPNGKRATLLYISQLQSLSDLSDLSGNSPGNGLVTEDFEDEDPCPSGGRIDQQPATIPSNFHHEFLLQSTFSISSLAGYAGAITQSKYLLHGVLRL